MRQETNICMNAPGSLLEMSRMMFQRDMNIQIPKVVLKSSALCDAGHTTHGKAASVFTCSRIRDSLSSRNLHSSLEDFHTLVNLSKPYV